MGGPQSPCPEPEVLAALCRGDLDDSALRKVESHFDECTTCARVVADLVRIYATAPRSDDPAAAPSGDSRHPTPPRAPVDAAVDAADPVHETTFSDGQVPRQKPPLLLPGARLDRYHVLDVVGRGGMGTVYAAYDPDLDRKVALKVLHHSDRGDDRAQRRLLREAQAMARLSHPNVITVHEARVADGRVFLSMEFVEGETLGRWVAKQKPELTDLLAMFRDVGRGLAAAHAAGLVHRDVKPENVLVGSDGRPRVTDFGLARPTDTTTSVLDVEVDGGLENRPISQDHRRLDATLTRADALVGTPAYMSPEQLRREPASAASDQFSFCVALFEALWGARPFAGKGLLELATNVVSGAIVEPAREPAVPRWLRSVVLRGLSVDPAARWPSMDALVERLEPPRRRRRPRLWLAGGAALATASGFALAGGTRPDPCAAADEQTQQIWNATARAAVFGSLATGAASYTEDAANLVLERLDAYAAQLAAGQRDACEDYHGGAQSHESLDLRRGCFDERLGDLGALVRVLEAADDEVRRNAVAAADGLPTITDCDDLDALRVRLPLPEEPMARARIRVLEQSRAMVEAEDRAGRYREGMEDADDLVAATREAGHAASLARALLVRSSLFRHLADKDRAIVDLREAWPVALGAGDEQTAALAIIGLVAELGNAGVFEEASLRTEEAHAMVERIRRHDPKRAESLRASLDEALGMLALRQHQYTDAAAAYGRALAFVTRQTGSDSLRTAQVLNALAQTKLASRDLAEAVELFGRVLAIREKLLGPLHPETAHAHNALGLAFKNLGQPDDAEAELLEARQLLVSALGYGDKSVRMVDVNLSELYYHQRRHAESAEIMHAVFGLEGVLESDDAFTMRRVVHYATSLIGAGRVAEGRTVVDLGLRILRAIPQGDETKALAREFAWMDDYMLASKPPKHPD